MLSLHVWEPAITISLDTFVAVVMLMEKSVSIPDDVAVTQMFTDCCSWESANLVSSYPTLTTVQNTLAYIEYN